MAEPWPDPVAIVDDFYDEQLATTRDLWRAFQVRTEGSGRPHGPRRLQWAATLVLAHASLEAGLESLFVAAHGFRTGQTGNPTLDTATRKYLVEDPLMSPSTLKINRMLFSAFGLKLSTLPTQATFTVRFKNQPNAGSGRGSAQASPADWSGLSELLQALSYVRNATAHGDVRKLNNAPPSGEGSLWVMKQDGRWSVQQPHALTGIRTVVAVYNAVATAIDGSIGMFGAASPLRTPDSVIDYTE